MTLGQYIRSFELTNIDSSIKNTVFCQAVKRNQWTNVRVPNMNMCQVQYVTYPQSLLRSLSDTVPMILLLLTIPKNVSLTTSVSK